MAVKEKTKTVKAKRVLSGDTRCEVGMCNPRGIQVLKTNLKKGSTHKLISIKGPGLFLAAGFLLLSVTGTAVAEYDSGQGGWTEIINCPQSSWDVCPLFHEKFYWGGSGPDIAYTSPSDWWTYAEPDGNSLDCSNWINGSIVGGATYEPGQPSLPQDVQVTISTQWWDFEPIVAGICGHQHATTYVWGWRYNGSSWSREFVTAHQRTSYENEQGICTFQAEGNPDYPPPIDDFAFGPEVIHIPNSPYAVLWTKTQATSHYNAGCGQFECFHPVRVRAIYDGGPGVNEGEPVLPQPTDELAIENPPVVEFDPNANLQGPTEGLQRGLKLDLESNVKRATIFYDSDSGAVVDGKRMVD